MYTLVKFCKARHESTAAASYFLDVAVSRGLIQTPEDYQVVAMASLYLGLKIFDSPRKRVVKLSKLVKLGSGVFDEHDVIQMEEQLLEVLEWRLNPPTPNCFLQQYLRLLPQDTLPETRYKIEDLSLQAIEISISRDYFAAMDPSVLAYAAILMSFNQMNEMDMHLDQLHIFVDNMADVAKLDHTIEALVQTYTSLDETIEDLSFSHLQKLASTETIHLHELDHEPTVGADGESPHHVAI
jgi:hypothetical protein